MGQPNSKNQGKWAGNNQGGGAGGAGSGQPSARKPADTSKGATAALATDSTLIDELAESRSGGPNQTPPTLPPSQSTLVPIVVRFKGQPTKQVPGGPPTRPGPKDVKVLFEFNQFKPIALTKSGDDFFAVLQVPPGSHQAKFRVDGVETVDPTLPTNGQGFNVIQANLEILVQREEDDTVTDDPSQWGHAQLTFEETRKFPAILPPHLRYTPLNAPPTQFRCDVDGTLTPIADVGDRDALPLPLSVTINHAYLQRRDDHIAVGTTTRFRNKFVSVIYYKGIDGSVPVSKTPLPM